MITSLAYSGALGRTWLDSFPIPVARPVLVLDNELKEKTLNKRYYDIGQTYKYGDEAPPITLRSLRGNIPNLIQLGLLFDRIEPYQFGLIILDAFYRFLPKGVSENDNSDVTQLYNILDGYASRTKAAILLVHHTSKGEQGGKSKVDVGSGAGSMSRAADGHLIIRPHEDEGLSVFEGETRSFKQPDPISLELNGLIWHKAEAAPIVRQAGAKLDGGKDASDVDKIVRFLADNGPASENLIFNRAGLGAGRPRLGMLLAMAIGEERIEEKPGEGSSKGLYSTEEKSFKASDFM